MKAAAPVVPGEQRPVIGLATDGHSWLIHQWTSMKPVTRGYVSICGSASTKCVDQDAEVVRLIKRCQRCFKPTRLKNGTTPEGLSS